MQQGVGDGRLLGQRLEGFAGDALEIVLRDQIQQAVFVVDVVVNGTESQVGSFGDLADGGLFETLFSEEARGGLADLFFRLNPGLLAAARFAVFHEQDHI